jgi:hypothetical protein
MNRKHYVLAAILLATGIVLFAVVRRPHAVTTKVAFSGPDGLQITGSFTADGKEHDVDETLPAEITITARRMSLLVESADETKTVRAKVFVDGKPRVSGAQRHIRVDVTGNTMFSSARPYLKAY